MAKRKAFLEEELSFQGRYSAQVFETLKFAYGPVLGRIGFFMVLGFFGRFFLLSNANLIGVWVDSLCQTPSECRPVPRFFSGFENSDYFMLLATVTAMGLLLTAGYRLGFARTSAAVVSGIYDEVTMRTSRFPIRFFDSNPVGRVVTRFSSDYSNIFRLFGGPLAELIAIIFDLSSMLILVAIASPFYIPVFVLIGFLNYGVYVLNRDRLRRERRAYSESRSPSIAHFAETAQGSSTIRIFGRQGTFAKRFKKLNDHFFIQKLRTFGFVLGFSMQMGAMTATLLLATGLSGYFLAKQGLVSVGSIGVAFTFVVLSGTSMQMFFEWMAQFEEAMTGVERLDSYLRNDIEPGAKLPARRRFPTSHPVYRSDEEKKLKTERLVSGMQADVSVENVWFRYGEHLPYVLKGINFQIRPGEKIGIVGRTGSGKSSLIQALFHLYPIERGRIAINGAIPKTAEESGVDLGLYRRSISLISQDPTLFRGTVRENLDLEGSLEDSRLLDAIQRVGLREWLANQPGGLDSPIEERGRNLSAGERQLLCMARCLLQDSPIVVMDEATSSIDPQSEEILVRATREFFSDRTQIIIAHRLSTLEHCDRILWLHQGEIKMMDRPDRVLPVFSKTQLA